MWQRIKNIKCGRKAWTNQVVRRFLKIEKTADCYEEPYKKRNRDL